MAWVRSADRFVWEPYSRKNAGATQHPGWQPGARFIFLPTSATQAGSLAASARRVAASVLLNALGRQFQHLIRRCGEEVPVVCETNSMAPSNCDRAMMSILFVAIFRCVFGLVQHQEFRRAIEHLHHHQPRPLTAGQHPNFFPTAGESEVAGQSAPRALPRPGERALQREARVLLEIADPDLIERCRRMHRHAIGSNLSLIPYLRLVSQNDIQQGTVDLNVTVIIN